MRSTAYAGSKIQVSGLLQKQTNLNLLSCDAF